MVAHPSVTIKTEVISKLHVHNSPVRFLYPSLPRVFKNFEILGEAVSLLNQVSVLDFELYLTIDGTENLYSRYIHRRYRHFAQLKFVGRQSSVQMHELYSSCDVVVFPSKLETWGLPLSEAKAYSSIILASDLPYARETVGSYDRVSFFPARSAIKLAHLMTEIIQGRWRPSGNMQIPVEDPFVSGWPSLWKYICQAI